MAGKAAAKQKDKATPEKAKKAAPAANGAAGLLANAYNPLLGTFHSMESGGPEAQENGGFNMFEGGPGQGDVSDSDTDDEKDEANGDEKRTGGAALKDKESRAEKRDREKMRLRNEKKHQRQKERRAQELKDKCLSLLTARKVEFLATQLEAMGFPKDQAVKAVTMHGGNLERGVSWLLEAGPEVAAASLDPGQAKVDIADELARVVDAEIKYGIQRGEVERVVVAHGGDLDRAMEALAAQHPVQRMGSEPGAAPNGVSGEQASARMPPGPPPTQSSAQGPRNQGGGQQTQAGPTPASAQNGPGHPGWAHNAGPSPGMTWGTPPSGNSTRQTWQGGQQPPPSQAFPPPSPLANGSPSPGSKQRQPVSNTQPSPNYPPLGPSFSRPSDPPLTRQTPTFSPEASRPEIASSQQRPPYQSYPYRPQALQQPAGGQNQGSPIPAQVSRLPATRPGGVLSPQQRQQFLTPQSGSQPQQLAPFSSPLQQQHLLQLQQQQLWMQQHKGSQLSPQKGAQQGLGNGQAPFARPNVRAFGPAQGAAQQGSLDPPKANSLLSAAAAPWPGGQGSGGAFSQTNVLTTADTRDRRPAADLFIYHPLAATS